MENTVERNIYQKPICASFGFIVKRKLCGAFIPFAVMFAAHIPVQMLLFWKTTIETPFLTAPLFMFLFFVFCSPVFSHRIEDKYGVTRTQSFLTSYIVATIYSLIITFFTLGLAELCNFLKYSQALDMNILIRPGESAVSFFYGFIVCLLMYLLSDIFYLFNRSGHLFCVILSAFLMIAIPFVCTGIDGSGVFFEYVTFYAERVYALITFIICFVVICGIDFILIRRGIR